MKVRVIAIVLLMAGIAMASLGLTALTYEPAQKNDGLSVVAATYPMYTAALQVVGDAPNVSVTCLIQPTAGCAHDYQLSPDEMAALSAADVLVRNGVGADDFLEGALTALPHLTQLHVSEGVEVLDAHGHHNHDHVHHDTFEANEHVWVSPSRYAQQVEKLRDGLCAADPAHAEQYTVNAAAYLEKIEQVHTRFVQVGAALKMDGAVLFHDSAAYAADELEIPVAAILPLGEEQGISAGDLTAAAQAVAGKRVLLLYDSQYASQEFSLDEYATHAVTVILDTAVLPRAGVADKDRWLHAMTENLKRLEAAI
ncbi:MAG: zinc ABC transporter substrate-binding protein [Clostridia bacterium]|nr:zinc ABC transporter substrate-binding protein [Clostridia bacterium]